MEYYESKFTNEHFIALGKMNVYFQFIENQIDRLLSVFLNTHFLSSHTKRMNALLSEIPFKTKCSTLRSLINDITSFEDIADAFPKELHDKSEKILDEIFALKPLFKKIAQCSSIRNKYIHSHWINGGICGPKNSVARYKLTAKGKGVKGEFVFECSSELESKAEYILQTYNELLDITMNLVFLAVPSDGESSNVNE